MAEKRYLDLTGVTYLYGKIKDAIDLKADASDVTSLQGLHANATGGGKKTVVQEIADSITALDLANTYAAKSTVDTLVGSDTAKSVRTIANEELAAQLIPANANEALDTLQEIAAWIQAHPGDASSMNSAISALETKVGAAASGNTAASGLFADIAAIESELGTSTMGSGVTVWGAIATLDSGVDALDNAFIKGTDDATSVIYNTSSTVDAALDSLRSTLNNSDTDTLNASLGNVSVVGAINANYTAISGLQTKVGSGTLSTGSDTNLVAAVNSLYTTVTGADTYTAITNSEIDTLIANANA